MRRSLIFVLAMTFAIAWGLAQSALSEGAAGQPAFRIRSDFLAALNSDKGWAGSLNENANVHADRPFRIRFEAVFARGTTTAPEAFRLQYRRNQGSWTDIEVQDFPNPSASVVLNFTQLKRGAVPPGWTVARGNPAGLAVTGDEPNRVLRAESDRRPLVGLYQWHSKLTEFEFETRVRMASGKPSGVGLVFGYLDLNNRHQVFLDAAKSVVRVSRFVDGDETVLAEQRADVLDVSGWLEVAIELDDDELEVNLANDALEFTVDVGAVKPMPSLGFYVPANTTAEFEQFEIQGTPRTPRVSIVTCPAYENGAATIDLLKGAANPFRAGSGVSFDNRTRKLSAGDGHSEFEWPLVVRRFADGPVANEQGDIFEFRMVAENANTKSRARNPVLRLDIPPGHVGGTFVETPGRIGPWQASNGDIYFIMEPTETDNVFMMVKSTDNGRTWREVDGANRPRTDDLEAVDARQVQDTIHIIHQVTESTWYHAFRTSDHPRQPDSWSVRDQLAARANAVAQAATLVRRSDGSMVAFYVGESKIHYSVRSPAGVWGSQETIDPDVAPNLAGPQAVLGADETIHLAYYGTDGTIWYRRLEQDGKLGSRQQIARGVGTTRADFGAVLPLLFIPQTKTLVIIYRLSSGELWERRISDDGPPTAAVRVTDRKVVRNAVDSQQPGADAVLDGTTVHVAFIEQSSRGIFITNDKDGWQPSRLLVDNILGSWIRGNIYSHPDGTKVYGYIYDAGSDGGAGINRYDEIPIGQFGRLSRP